MSAAAKVNPCSKSILLANVTVADWGIDAIDKSWVLAPYLKFHDAFSKCCIFSPLSAFLSDLWWVVTRECWQMVAANTGRLTAAPGSDESGPTGGQKDSLRLGA